MLGRGANKGYSNQRRSSDMELSAGQGGGGGGGMFGGNKGGERYPFICSFSTPKHHNPTTGNQHGALDFFV